MKQLITIEIMEQRRVRSWLAQSNWARRGWMNINLRVCEIKTILQSGRSPVEFTFELPRSKLNFSLIEDFYIHIFVYRTNNHGERRVKYYQFWGANPNWNTSISQMAVPWKNLVSPAACEPWFTVFIRTAPPKISYTCVRRRGRQNGLLLGCALSGE